MKKYLFILAVLIGSNLQAQPSKQPAPTTATKTCTFILLTSEYCGQPAAPKCANRCKKHKPDQMRKQAAYARMRRAKKH